MSYRVMKIVAFTILTSIDIPTAPDRFQLDNLESAIKECNSLRGLYPMTDYVVFDEQTQKIAYRAADHNIKPNGILYGIPEEWSE